jgi:low affinity Fe/Cu permease
MHEFFHRFARATSKAVGSPFTFVLALLVVLSWALAGPFFDYSENWQLVINTGTTIVTFLIVFVIQNTQNHDSKAVHLKLDELIRAVEKARDKMVDIEDSSETELARIGKEMRAVRDHVAPDISGRRDRNPDRGTVDDTGDQRG